MPSTNHLAERIASYAVGLRFDDLESAAIHEAKRRVIDSLGCALGAFAEDPCVIARRAASVYPVERGGATLLGTRTRVSPDWAAFANGCAIRYFDYNDTYLSREPAHPSDNLAAVLAAAEAAGAGGPEVIVAVVLAYEVQCRLCDASSLRARGWDHVTYGCFSSAAAAARLMGLSELQARHALGIAGVASAALRQTRVGELSHWKGCAFANAARHGTFAALLAREGMTGPAPIFEGEKGFEKLVSGRLEDLKGPFALTPDEELDGEMILRTSIKCWPAEYHAQSAVAAALKLRQQIASPALIESVVVESHDAAVDIIGSEPEKWQPTSRETADHSLPYMTAAALADGELTATQFAPERFTDPALLDLVRRVQVWRNVELSEGYPRAVGNIVTVRLHDGRELKERVDYPPGHARNPMSDAAVEAKFHALVDPVLGADRADSVLEWAWDLDEAESVATLMELIEMAR